MQTCVGSVAGTAFTGGFGSYLIAMDQQSYENVGNIAGNNAWVRLTPVCWSAQNLHAWIGWTMSTNPRTVVAALSVTVQA